MANLKLDLQNKIKNDHYYNEMELSRLAQDPMINYELKVKNMSEILSQLALTEQKLALIENVYMPEPQKNIGDQPKGQAPMPQPSQSPAPHPGQSHGE